MSQVKLNKANTAASKISKLAYFLLLTCISFAHAAKEAPAIKVTNILPTELFFTGKVNDLLWRDTCDNWNLSSKQIEEFFKLSREYEEGKEYAEYSKTFDWAHCSILGTLVAENSEWNFEINASGAAEWRNEHSVRAWGCSDVKCKPFLIPDQNHPVIPPKPNVHITKIYSAEFDKRYDLIESTQDVEDNYCQSWQLSGEQAQEFFKISDEYIEGRFQLFNWFPCNVTGELEADGKQWQFLINQAGTGIWRSGDIIRFWGCLSAACKDLNLIIPDDDLEPIDDK